MNNEKKFIKLTPFKMQVLQTFPFIDEDFDAITNYELLCKVVDYLNKTVDNVDLLNEKVEELESYFNTLNVQEEINNKLDEMAESGELADIINQEIFTELNNSLNALRVDTNIIDNKLSNKLKNPYIHISFDDIANCITDLKNNINTYTSIFNNNFLNYLKTLHDTYNATFSLYVFTDTFNTLTASSAYITDFKNNSNWLKIGFHAENGNSNFENTNYNSAKNIYNSFITSIKVACGTTNIIDRVPRLGNYAGNYGALCALRDCNGGCIGFLSADDDRLSYYFNLEQNKYINRYYQLFDYETGLYFIKTLPRLDGLQTNVIYTTLEDIYNNSGIDSNLCLEVFAHESATYITNGKLEEVCRFASDYNISFDFAQNRIQNQRSITTRYYDNIMAFGIKQNIYNAMNDVEFVNGNLALASAPNIFVTGSNTGRAIVPAFIKIPVGSKLIFDNQTELDLQYAMVEWGGDPITNNQRTFGETYARWLTATEFTFNPDTKFIVLIVKNNTTSNYNFSSEELLAIKNSFTVE